MRCNFENVDNHENRSEQNFQTKLQRIPAKPPLYEPDGLLTNKSAPKSRLIVLWSKYHTSLHNVLKIEHD